MSEQFIGYHVDDYREDGVPVSTGTTADEARSSAIRRILSLGVTFGGIAVQSNDTLSASEFAELGAKLDDWFHARTPPKEQP